jgi:hypothetical protein
MMRLTIILLFIVSLASCSTSTQIINTDLGSGNGSMADSVFSDTDYIVMDYTSVRARADDPLSSVSNPFPDDYRFVTTGSTVSNNRQGFRVQLLSTQDRNEAEMMLENYKIWLASQRLEYKPKGYIQFRAPFFRVHVGDYYDRNIAFELVKLMKNQFPDAWIVADTIDPEEAAKN